MTKKVVIVIVEGESDEALLTEFLSERYREYNIRFECQHGDIMYNNKRGKAIQAIIGDTVKDICRKRKYGVQDILCVIHIIDTDGCLSPSYAVKVDYQSAKTTYYSSDGIFVNSPMQRENILNRNKKRSINIKIMNSARAIVGDRYKYQMYYFSRNLEHVMFNNMNPPRNDKVAHVLSYLENPNSNLGERLNKNMPNINKGDYIDMYRKSWDIIEEGINSLHRYTNVPLILKYIDEAIS